MSLFFLYFSLFRLFLIFYFISIIFFISIFPISPLFTLFLYFPYFFYFLYFIYFPSLISCLFLIPIYCRWSLAKWSLTQPTQCVVCWWCRAVKSKNSTLGSWTVIARYIAVRAFRDSIRAIWVISIGESDQLSYSLSMMRYRNYSDNKKCELFIIF